MRTRFIALALLLLIAEVTVTRAEQFVAVTAQLDTNIIAVGQTTTLHIYAQVLPGYRDSTDRIFSWYVDVLNTNGAAANANYAAMQKTNSDNNLQTSSTGVSQAANRSAIYDTFENLPGAGVTIPVELMRIPVTGLAAGQTRFGVQHGTGVSLVYDFLVADGGEGLFGGDYSASLANLTVLGAPSNSISCLSLTRTNLAGGLNQVTVQFCPLAGYNHYVEYRDQLVGGPGWQTFPNGPHNSGVYVETNGVPVRFYRIRGVPAGGLAAFRLDITQLNATQLRLTYPIAAGFNYTIESRTNLVTGSWQPWPGGPHNTGNEIVTNAGARLFFRVGALPQ